jgi:hypothetical protein
MPENVQCKLQTQLLQKKLRKMDRGDCVWEW